MNVTVIASEGSERINPEQELKPVARLPHHSLRSILAMTSFESGSTIK
jgi:hypothetical protein